MSRWKDFFNAMGRTLREDIADRRVERREKRKSEKQHARYMSVLKDFTGKHPDRYGLSLEGGTFDGFNYYPKLVDKSKQQLEDMYLISRIKKNLQSGGGKFASIIQDQIDNMEKNPDEFNLPWRQKLELSTNRAEAIVAESQSRGSGLSLIDRATGGGQTTDNVLREHLKKKP